MGAQLPPSRARKMGIAVTCYLSFGRPEGYSRIPGTRQRARRRRHSDAAYLAGRRTTSAKLRARAEQLGMYFEVIAASARVRMARPRSRTP